MKRPQSANHVTEQTRHFKSLKRCRGVRRGERLFDGFGARRGEHRDNSRGDL